MSRIVKKEKSRKSEKREMLNEMTEKIVEELLSSGKVRPWQSIDITQFNELYEPYKDQMSKTQFAIFLEVIYNNLKNGQKAIILKSRINEFLQEEIKEIKKEQETNPNGACIKLLARYKELEVPKTQAIKNTEEVLGMSPEEMLEAMKAYKAEQKKREAAQNKGMSIG